MERIKIFVIICACIFVRSGQSLTIEELSPLLETLKVGIRTEILSEVTSITTELGNNMTTTIFYDFRTPIFMISFLFKSD